MMERPSLHHNWILKCTAFQVGSDLSPIAIILPRRPRVKVKHTDQRFDVSEAPIVKQVRQISKCAAFTITRYTHNKRHCRASGFVLGPEGRHSQDRIVYDEASYEDIGIILKATMLQLRGQDSGWTESSYVTLT